MDKGNNIKESELRQTTVMFADISGFTAMSEKMTPEEITSLMNDCFRVMGRIIENNEGIIDKFIGDCVMVLFGVPTAIENAPYKALKTAIEIRNKIYQFNEERNLNFPLNIHIGINSGIVLAGAIGSDSKTEYTVMGDTVNLASRLEEISDTGQILVGPATYRATSDKFEYRELKPVTVKGKDNAINVFELLTIKEKIYKQKFAHERMIQSKMIGRDSHIDKLELLVKQANNGKGSIVNIIGEAGIGKSRLVAELKNMDALKRVNLLEGRAISIGRNLSFHPIIDLIKNSVAIEKDDDEITAFNKLEATLQDVYPEEVDEMLPFIALLMGMTLTGKYAERVKGIEGEELENLILKTVRELLVKSSELIPLAIIIEDIHWADTSSIEFIVSLFRLAERHKILFVNVFRPDYDETSNYIVKSIKDKYSKFYTEIYLEPLDEKQSEELIEHLLNIKGLPKKMREQVLQRTEGNPFFIEEVVHTFIDNGAVVLKNGRFEITEKVEEIVIPFTINDVLMSRIDSLDEDTKSLVKVASVIGRSFFYKILSEVIDGNDELDQSIKYLKDVQLIRERERMKELEYIFKHMLAQEVAYESILLQKRRDLHLKVANSIENIFGKRLHEFYGILAYHYSSGEDLDKAEEFMIKAGEEALKSSASTEALKYYQQALKLYQKKYGKEVDPEKIAIMEMNIGLALFNKGQYHDAIPYFDKVLVFYGVKIPQNPVLLVFKFFICFIELLIRLYFPSIKSTKKITEEVRYIINLFHKKLIGLSTVNPTRFFFESHYFIKILLNINFEEVENWAEMFTGASNTFAWPGISFKLSSKILEYSKDKIDKNDVKSLLLYKFSELLHNFLRGDWRDNHYDDNLVNSNIRIGEIFFISAYITWLGYIKIEYGYYDEAVELIDKLSEYGNDFDHDYTKALKFELEVKLLIKYRKLDQAIIESEKGIEFTKKEGINVLYFVLLSFQARILVSNGNISKAENRLQSAYKIKSNINPVPFHLSYLLTSQFIFDLYQLEGSIKRGNKQDLSIKKKKALQTCRRLIKNSRKVASDRTEAYKLIGTLYWIIGKQKRGMRWWKKSITWGERLNARIELSRVYMEAGKRLQSGESKYKEINKINAEDLLEKARSMFTEMNLEQDLDELNKI